jgi:Mlc titration factor MtfA (ptsG expression regulator)
MGHLAFRTKETGAVSSIRQPAPWPTTEQTIVSLQVTGQKERSLGPLMIFAWLRSRRRKRWQNSTFPAEWSTTLDHHVGPYRNLDAQAQERLRQFIQVFIREKNWEGCGGFVVTDEVKVTISGWVGILVIGRQPEYFDHVLSILVYPSAYQAPVKIPAGGGVVLEGQSSREGEAWYRGPVILSWSDVITDSHHRHRGTHLVLHEFAHQLDMQDGHQTNGIPRLPWSQRETWEQVMNTAFREHCRQCDRGQNWLDPYAATNPQEFFAVMTEAFFEAPDVVIDEAPDVFEQFKTFYRIDPRSLHSSD